MTDNQHNTVFSEDLIHIIFDYYCSQENEDKFVAPDHENQYIEVSEQELNEKLLKLIPKVLILGENVLWDGKVEESFLKIKQAYIDHFNNYQEVERHQLKWMSGLREKCLYKECGEAFSSAHIVNEHTISVFARDMTHNEIPFRYGATRFEKHILTHTVKCDGNFSL